MLTTSNIRRQQENLVQEEIVTQHQPLTTLTPDEQIMKDAGKKSTHLPHICSCKINISSKTDM